MSKHIKNLCKYILLGLIVFKNNVAKMCLLMQLYPVRAEKSCSMFGLIKNVYHNRYNILQYN